MKNWKVFQEDEKWCFEVCGKKFCEGDVVDICCGKGVIKFGLAVIPDNEAYGDNIVMGFYIRRIGKGQSIWGYARHMEDVLRKIVEKDECKSIVDNGWVDDTRRRR